MSSPSLRTYTKLGCVDGVGRDTLLVDELLDLQEQSELNHKTWNACEWRMT